MKSSIVFTILLCALTAAVARIDPSESSTKDIKTKDKNPVALNMDKKLMGAHMEVLTATGNCVICQKASGRKMNINLSHVEAGSYTVKIGKDGIVEEFQFVQE